MVMAVMTWMAIPILGCCTGFRAMTPIALVCWYARLGYLPLQGTWGFWAAHPVSVGVFTALAIGELIGDKLPSTPARTAPFPLLSRLCFGGVVGALVATGLRGSVVEGVVLAVIGAVIGTFGGYHLRRYLTKGNGWSDVRVALLEDGTTIVLASLALKIATG